VSQEIVGCMLKLWKESKLLLYTRPDVVKVFQRLEKSDNSRVAGRFIEILKAPVVPVSSLSTQVLQCIGVGAQSFWGETFFARKYMHEKLTKCPNFT